MKMEKNKEKDQERKEKEKRVTKKKEKESQKLTFFWRFIVCLQNNLDFFSLRNLC